MEPSYSERIFSDDQMTAKQCYNKQQNTGSVTKALTTANRFLLEGRGFRNKEEVNYARCHSISEKKRASTI